MDTKLKDLLSSCGFRFNKALGQNFISDTNLLESIVSDSGIQENDIVVEIGTGAGTLTRAISAKCKKVYSFEVDKNLAPVLDLSLQGVDNVEVVFKDVLKMKDDEFVGIIGDGEFKVVANLPYYVTTPLIMRFLESELKIKSLTIMVQKEVGDRIVATAGTADYSAITLAVKMRGNAKITRKVPRTVFYPSPNVDSAVVRIDIDENILAGENKELVHKLVRSAFAMRRKTLVNNLSSAFSMTKSDVEEKIVSCGFDAMVRGETLTLDDFVKLSKVF